MINLINPTNLWNSFPPSNEPEDLRIGHIIKPLLDYSQLAKNDIVLLGIPQDIGVQRNGGRLGAKDAPESIRKSLAKLSVFGLGEYQERTMYDAGDIDCSNASLEEIREKHVEVILELLKREVKCIVLGGGHDIAFPNAMAVNKVFGDYSVVNIDPHLDVRENTNNLSHSGTPFREMLENCPPKTFIEFGTQEFSASKIHRDFVVNHGGIIIPFSDYQVPEYFEEIVSSSIDLSKPLYMSFDVDSVASAYAPGVSAPATIGFTSGDICSMAYKAGRFNATIIDFVEVNPSFDKNDQTSRLAANAIAWALKGWFDLHSQP